MCIHEGNIIIHWLLLKWTWDQLPTGLEKLRPFSASAGSDGRKPPRSWEHVLMLLKLGCAYKSPGILLKHGFWLSRSGAGPGTLQYDKFSSPGNSAGPGTTLRSKAKSSIPTASLFDPNSTALCLSFFRVASSSSSWHRRKSCGWSCLYCCHPRVNVDKVPAFLNPRGTGLPSSAQAMKVSPAGKQASLWLAPVEADTLC